MFTSNNQIKSAFNEHKERRNHIIPAKCIESLKGKEFGWTRLRNRNHNLVLEILMIYICFMLEFSTCIDTHIRHITSFRYWDIYCTVSRREIILITTAFPSPNTVHSDKRYYVLVSSTQYTVIVPRDLKNKWKCILIKQSDFPLTKFTHNSIYSRVIGFNSSMKFIHIICKTSYYNNSKFWASVPN
jgi:hypothetical protein